MDSTSIEIKYLDYTDENVELVTKLMLKDTSDACFQNAYIDDEYVPVRDMASIYLSESDLYAINYDDTCVGLLSLTFGNEIGIYIEPNYQSLGIGKYVLKSFIDMVKNTGVDEIITEMTLDNDKCRKIMESFGFEEDILGLRFAQVNNSRKLVRKYVLKTN